MIPLTTDPVAKLTIGERDCMRDTTSPTCRWRKKRTGRLNKRCVRLREVCSDIEVDSQIPIQACRSCKGITTAASRPMASSIERSRSASRDAVTSSIRIWESTGGARLSTCSASAIAVRLARVRASRSKERAMGLSGRLERKSPASKCTRGLSSSATPVKRESSCSKRHQRRSRAGSRISALPFRTSPNTTK